MNVCGVSTRNVSRIVEELCGHAASRSTISRVAGQLDEELGPWRNRAIGDVPYLILDVRYEERHTTGAVITMSPLTGW